ncbi:MAG: hypothetical protein A4E25_02255 [Methanobacterium sp. PtaB.Bin024]|jgi:hypothetical protein|nr:MAG: hypothetical protein A4E25_02255 [Methanobacterium sp. PtaB.Bin024]
MVNIKEFLYPNKFKITLFLLLFIPSIALIILLLGQNYIYSSYDYFYSSFILVDALLFLTSISPFILLGVILSYFLGCFIDYYIPNEKTKITIAIISGIVSLIIVYIFYKMITEPVICDPVHVPSNNQTVCDPVHKPSGSYSALVLGELKIDKSAVENSFQQCINKLND